LDKHIGSDGSRNALDRLRKHETRQKIAVQGVPEGYRLELVLFEVVPATRVITMFNPKAEDKTQGGKRIKAGLDKLFGTNEKERVCLFEAAFIRYFRPPFNEKFKDSFLSTNMKVLKDCYDKDFSAVIAEIGFDELPYKLCCDQVEAKDHRIASFNLSTEEERAVFFRKLRAEVCGPSTGASGCDVESFCPRIYWPFEIAARKMANSFTRRRRRTVLHRRPLLSGLAQQLR
jgi:hypothetical protein